MIRVWRYFRFANLMTLLSNPPLHMKLIESENIGRNKKALNGLSHWEKTTRLFRGVHCCTDSQYLINNMV